MTNKKNKIIYCNGDSFVAGDELADHEFFDDHPGLLSVSDSNEKKRIAAEWRRKSCRTRDGETNRKLRELERIKAFPNRLQEITGIPVINDAVGGASFERIARTTITSLIDLKNEYSEITAIIGLTCPDRFEIPSRHQLRGFDENLPEWDCINPAWEDLKGQDGRLINLINYQRIATTKNFRYTRLYLNMILIKDFCELHNIRLLWLEAGWHFPEENPGYASNLREYIDFHSSGNMGTLGHLLDTNALCADGHWAEVVHHKFAKELSKYFKDY